MSSDRDVRRGHSSSLCNCLRLVLSFIGSFPFIHIIIIVSSHPSRYVRCIFFFIIRYRNHFLDFLGDEIGSGADAEHCPGPSLLDLELLYVSTLEAYALGFLPFNSNEQRTQLKKLFSFLEKCRSKWWRESDRIEERYEAFLGSVLQELRKEVRVARASPAGEDEGSGIEEQEGPSEEGGKMAASQLASALFFQWLIGDVFPNNRFSCRALLRMFRKELIAMAPLGHRPSSLICELGLATLRPDPGSEGEEQIERILKRVRTFSQLYSTLHADLLEEKDKNTNSLDLYCAEIAETVGIGVPCRCGKPIGECGDTQSIVEFVEAETTALKWLDNILDTELHIFRRDGQFGWKLLREANASKAGEGYAASWLSFFSTAEAFFAAGDGETDGANQKNRAARRRDQRNPGPQEAFDGALDMSVLGKISYLCGEAWDWRDEIRAAGKLQQVLILSMEVFLSS